MVRRPSRDGRSRIPDAIAKNNPDRVGDVRAPGLFWALVGSALIVCLAILFITSYMNFFWDEWDFISYDRAWSMNVLFLPHNEHWSTIPILVWKLLFVLVGLRSHLPYEAALLVAHAAAVLLLFALVRRSSSDLPAFAAALILLVLGSGGTNIAWAFQIGFVASVAFGLLAMLLLEVDLPVGWHLFAVSGAVLCSLMCSAVGLAFVAAIAVELLLDKRRRRFLLTLVVPMLAFAVWFLAYGAELPNSPGAPCPTCLPTGFRADIHRGPISVSYLVSLASFVGWGLQATAEGIFGFVGIGAILLPALALLIGWRWVREGRVASWHAGLVAGLVAWFLLTSLGRAQQGPTSAGEPRYIYVGVVFLLPLVVHALRDLPWHGAWRPALVVLLAFALVGNISELRDRLLITPVPTIHPFSSQMELMRFETADLEVASVFRGAPDMPLDQSIDNAIMPQLNPRPYFGAVDELGSPVPLLTLEDLRRIPAEVVDRAMVNLFGGALLVSPDHIPISQQMACQNVDSIDAASIDLQADGGQSVVLQSDDAGQAFIFLGYLAAPTQEPTQPIDLKPQTPQWIHLPDTGKNVAWRVRIAVTPVGMLRVCGAAPFQIVYGASNLYQGYAINGNLMPGWSVVDDESALTGRAAKAARGSYPRWMNDVFEVPFVPSPGRYDVWYRVRVATADGVTPEMTLGLWDDEGFAWAGSTSYKPNQVGTTYSWVKVATGITPSENHHFQFLAAFPNDLGTDWYLDKAVLVPAGPAAP